MKKDKKLKPQISLLFLIFLTAALAIILVIIVLGCVYLKQENWVTILTNLTKDAFTAILITSIIGTFYKMLLERFFIIKKNDRLLKKFGVQSVGTGISTGKDKRNIFGNKFLGDYPKEIRMLYVTGIKYLQTFENELEECLENGCEIKILLISEKEEKGDGVNHYISRLAEMYKTTEDEIIKQLKEVKEKIKDLNELYPNKISIRFYQDEYFYNFRSAAYLYKNDRILYKCNINIQPFNHPASEYSIGLSGTYYDDDEETKKADKNIFVHNNEAFDMLWNKYDYTEVA